MPEVSKRRALARKIVRPIMPMVVSVMYFKIGGRQLFINKYTHKIPIYSLFIKRLDELVARVQANHEREKEYKKWVKKHFPSSSTLKRQHDKYKSFRLHPKISIIVPTYNTEPKLLRACLDSVQAQSYPNWELCIADDASTNPEVRKIIQEYATNDERIRYIFQKQNGHICKASNAALSLATGKYIALLDHDDYLWPNALFEVVTQINRTPQAALIYSDEDKIDENHAEHKDPFFKPNWSPEFLRSINYITHFAVLDRKLVTELGGFRPGYEGAQDWDLFLRISRATEHIYHIPKILYSWRTIATSTASAPSAKDYAYVNQKKALEDDIEIRGLKAELSWQIPFSMWKVQYKTNTNPLVSIVIPTKDQHGIIRQCLISIRDLTTYKNYETVIVDTGSTDGKVWELYKEFEKLINLRVVVWDGKPFNFASACNYGADHAKGQYLLFLNNDTEVITPTWIEDMLGYASQPEIGPVGCKLYYPDGKLQHGGIILGVGGQHGTPGIAGHFFPAFRENPPQDPAQLLYDGGTRNFAAVTAACVMIERKKFEAVKGFDPKFRIAFNDVDLCLKLLKSGWRNVYLPHVELYHHESISVGLPGSKQRDLDVFAKEIRLMLKKWGKLIADDPYYHPEFRRDIASARLKH